MFQACESKTVSPKSSHSGISYIKTAKGSVRSRCSTQNQPFNNSNHIALANMDSETQNDFLELQDHLTSIITRKRKRDEDMEENNHSLARQLEHAKVISIRAVAEARVSGSMAAGLQKRNEQLEEDNAEIQYELSKLEDEIGPLGDKVEKLEEKAMELEFEVEELKDEVEELNDEVKVLKDELKTERSRRRKKRDDRPVERKEQEAQVGARTAGEVRSQS